MLPAAVLLLAALVLSVYSCWRAASTSTDARLIATRMLLLAAGSAGIGCAKEGPACKMPVICMILRQCLLNVCKVASRCPKVCCCTWNLLHSRRNTGRTENSLQRVQGSWADLGSKSFYGESDILEFLRAASQQPVGDTHS